MDLRNLDLKDANRMLEWMHDEEVVKDLGANFKEKTLEDCVNFIIHCNDESSNYHLAIVDDHDVYMGTVSLKNINYENNSAEFAITVHKDAMGKGYSKYGMNKIIELGFSKFKLKDIYWYVKKNNTRAIRFYEKNGYKKINGYEFSQFSDEETKNMLWYLVTK